jgi:phage terminase small subunit
MATKKIKPRKPTPRRELTLKQRSFCTWYVSAEVAGNATEAARRAGYKGNDVTLGRVGNENVKKPLIAAEIAKLEKQILKDADVTIEKVLRDLENERLDAMKAGQYGAAVRCSELQGKYLKMFVDRIEHVQTIEDVSDAELVRLLLEIVEVGQIDLIGILAGDPAASSLLSATAGAPTTH